MQTLHKLILAIAISIVVIEVVALAVYYPTVLSWIKHHWWVVILPFSKAIIKKIITLKLFTFFKALLFLLWHLSKLLLIKVLKTLGLRYGLFFSQRRWYTMRKIKVLFLRRGKQFFRRLMSFWQQYGRGHKWLILVAFFPIFVVLFFLSFSFNVTRKSIVQKTQETALVKMASTASQKNKGLRGFIGKWDQTVLEKIKQLQQ